jgi:alkaline phosphatase D
VHVELDGLRPDRDYWYRFTALGAQSAVGRGRTLPREDAEVSALRLGFVSCSHWELGWFSAYRHLAEERPDLILLLGDYIYEYSYTGRRADRTVRKHDQTGEVTTLAGYRNRYALYRTDPDLQALHASAPCLMTWDDHEVENDYSGLLPQDVAEDAGFARRRAAAYQAYYEHMPLRRISRPTAVGMRLYKRFRFGRLAEITMLDGRQYRSAPACPTPQSRRARVIGDECLERLDPARSMLGRAQERWLFDGFRRSDARWNIIGQDLLATSLRQKGANGMVGHWTDGWDGYPATRDRMLAAMQLSRLSNPVILGGDIHSYWATDLKADFRDPESRTIATEFVGTGVTADGPPYDDFMAMLPENPHVRYFESRRHGYVSVEVRRDRLEARFQAISDRGDPAATVATLAAFAVEDGQPGAVASSPGSIAA